MQKILSNFLVSRVTKMASVPLYTAFAYRFPLAWKGRVGVNIIIKGDEQTYKGFHFYVLLVFKLIIEMNVHV